MKNLVEDGQISLFDMIKPLEPEKELKVTSEDIERVLLFKHGLGYIEARIKVYNHFISNNNNCSDRFLKEVYGTCGKINGKDSKGIGYSDTYMETGIEISKGKIALFMPWNYIALKISLLIRDNKFLTNEEKVKYGLIKVKENKAVTPYNTIVDKYKKDCRFIVLGKHGLMVHMKNKAMFFTQDGKMKDEIDSTYIPPKPLGKILVDNIGYSDRIIKTEKQENSFAKGEKVKVNFEGKERAGIVHSIYNEGNTINVLFKDKNCVQPWYKNYVRKD